MDKKVEHSLEIIQQAIDNYDKISVACSFGKDSIVCLHLVRRINPNIPVFAVMTPFKPKETFELMEKVRREWSLNLRVYQSKEQVPENLYKTNPEKCCFLLKVRPTMEAVKDLDAWICGLRRDEGSTRHNCQEFEKRGSLVKVNPIVDWLESDVWRYIAVNKLPVHSWYESYRSLGCSPCSAPNTKTERNGRWQGFDKKECGIHSVILKGENKGECVNDKCKL